MSTCVHVYVHVVVCIQVLFTDVYKPICMTFTGTNAEIHFSDLYVSM